MHAHIMHTLFNRLQKDVDILVKVARQWAGCLTWSRVSHGGWSYPGITTKLLKQDLHKPQIEVGARQAGRQGRQAVKQADRQLRRAALTAVPSQSEKYQRDRPLC